MRNPDRFKTEEGCNEAVALDPYTLKYIPDQYKTKGMCDAAVCINPAVLFLIPDHFKTQEMCIKGVEVDLNPLIVLKCRTCAIRQ